MEDIIQEFDAMEEDGTVHRLRVYAELIDVGTRGNPNAVGHGLKSIKTVNGRSVNWLDKGKYKVVQTGLLLHSDSPDAP